MKKLFFIFIFFSLPLFFISCGEEDKILSEDEFFIAFEGTSANLAKTSDDTLKIPVYIAAERGGSVTVNIGIDAESTAVLDTDFEFVRGPQLVYEIGAGYDSLMIISHEGGTAGNLILDLFLESNSAGYKMGFFYGENADSTSHDVFRVNITE